MFHAGLQALHLFQNNRKRRLSQQINNGDISISKFFSRLGRWSTLSLPCRLVLPSSLNGSMNPHALRQDRMADSMSRADYAS
jgi:hypothetical protein